MSTINLEAVKAKIVEMGYRIETFDVPVEALPKTVSMSPSDGLGIDKRSRTIYLDRVFSGEEGDLFQSFLLIHEMAHMVLWSALGTDCPESLLIAWENRLIRMMFGEEAGERHLDHDYTLSSPIRVTRNPQTGLRQTASILELGIDSSEIAKQDWWISANEELDKLKMDGQVSAMFRRPSALRLKQAFIRQAHLQGFQLPEAWQQ
jgi:hypothetical protein